GRRSTGEGGPAAEPWPRRPGWPAARPGLPRPHVHPRVPARNPGRGSDARGRGVPAGRDLRPRRSRGRMPAMISVRRAGVLVLLLLAPSAPAHIVPVPPSTCVFDPVTIEAPASGVVGTAAPPEAADQFHIFYDPAASQATFDMQSVPPRSFTVAGVDGTFALPGLVVGTLISSGDLTLITSLAFTMNGSTTSVPITLTTGLAAAADMVVEGMPIASDGRFALVGITAASGLGPPLGGQLLAVLLPCQAVPRPGPDQFHFATRTTH